jgi:hypothetical protein
VLRWNSRTPRFLSSIATFRLTAAGDSASRRAAVEKPPVSALRTKDSRLASVSKAGLQAKIESETSNSGLILD